MKWEPDDFELEKSSVWSFPERGEWATHDSKYRGNSSPYVISNLLLRYSKEGDWVFRSVFRWRNIISRGQALIQKRGWSGC